LETAMLYLFTKKNEEKEREFTKHHASSFSFFFFKGTFTIIKIIKIKRAFVA